MVWPLSIARIPPPLELSIKKSSFVDYKYIHVYKFEASSISYVDDTAKPHYIVGNDYLINGRSDIQRFTTRLANIGINVEIVSNVPFIYLRSVNGVAITEKYQSEHGFCSFMIDTKTKTPMFTNRKKVFEKVRESVL